MKRIEWTLESYQMRRPGAADAEVARGFLVPLPGAPSWRFHLVVPRQLWFAMG